MHVAEWLRKIPSPGVPAFNSLFEMLAGRDVATCCVKTKLSILYLRCDGLYVPIAKSETITSFNSLFEMLAEVYRIGDREYVTFNSLFEMPPRQARG